MTEIEKIKDEIEKIKARNRRVERDKKWETSIVRNLGGLKTEKIKNVHFNG